MFDVPDDFPVLTDEDIKRALDEDEAPPDGVLFALIWPRHGPRRQQMV